MARTKKEFIDEELEKVEEAQEEVFEFKVEEIKEEPKQIEISEKKEWKVVAIIGSSVVLNRREDGKSISKTISNNNYKVGYSVLL